LREEETYVSIIPNECVACHKPLDPISVEEAERREREAVQMFGGRKVIALRFCADCGALFESKSAFEMIEIIRQRRQSDERKPHLHCTMCGHCVRPPTAADQAEILMDLGREWNAETDPVICSECGESLVKAAKAGSN